MNLVNQDELIEQDEKNNFQNCNIEIDLEELYLFTLVGKYNDQKIIYII